MTNSEAVEIIKRMPNCDGCVLPNSCKECEEAHKMAISALQEAETRVLSFDEAHGAVEPIVLEIKESNWLWWVDVALYDKNQSLIRNLYDEHGKVYGRKTNEYGKTWRCWNKRPTNEQRKAVAWE